MILVRSSLFNAWFFGITIVIGVFGIFVRLFRPERALAVAQTWAGLVLDGARVICGIEAEVTGLERIPPGPALIASQHQSAFDTLIWLRLVPKVSYVFKTELARIPLFGPLLVPAGQIPLDRGASVASVRKLLQAAERAKADGRQIVIFPEGTRVAAGVEAELRGGFTLLASRTGLPVYPVATDSGRVWGRRAFRKRPGRVHVHVGEPIAPNLPQAELVRTLRERWREAGLGPSPVDKSVDQIREAPPGAGAAAV